MGKGMGQKKGKKADDSSDDDSDGGHKKKKKKKSSKKGKKVKRSDEHIVRATHAAATDHANDGIETLGRLGIFLGTVSLVMYLMAMIQPSWTVVEDLGNGKFVKDHPYFSRVTKAEFGMYQFCLSTKVPELADEVHKVCWFNYKDADFTVQGDAPVVGLSHAEDCADLTKAGGPCAGNTMCTCNPETGVVTSKERNAYDHFGDFNFRSRRANVEWVCLGILIIMVLGDIYSHLLIINAICCTLGALGGVACLVLWGYIKKDIDTVTGSTTDHGEGYIFLIVAFSTAFAGSLFCILDMVCHPNIERFGLFNDGISHFGLLGTLLGCLVWVLAAAALLYPKWAVTDLIEDGNHGFADVGLQNVGAMSFGLWSYCLGLPTDAIVGENLVCLSTSQEIQLLGLGEDKDGFLRSQNACDIFASVNYCARTEIIVCCLLVTMALAFVADVFSEKLLANGVSMFVCFLIQAAAVIQWIIFKIHITGPKSYGAADKVDVGIGFFLALMGMGCALFSSLTLYLDYRDICEMTNDFTQGKSFHDTNNCWHKVYIFYGTGTSGYDGKAEHLDKTERVAKGESLV